MSNILLGCIADDFTGATDLANNLVRAGLRTIQTVGTPSSSEEVSMQGVDAVVIALKSRTIEPSAAVQLSLEALAWLRMMGAKQIYFKYCSTFDSTARGNIGPVTEALMRALKTPLTVVTPAFPDNGRTIFKGHLFVGDTLLSDSSMRNHPLTPMTDSSLVRLMQAQFKGQVGLVDYTVVSRGAAAIKGRLDQLRSNVIEEKDHRKDHVAHTRSLQAVVVDAISNQDLMALGAAVKDLELVTAGSGLAIGLAQNYGLKPDLSQATLPKTQGFRAILSGSCSQMTLQQVAHFKSQGLAHFEINPAQLALEPNYVNAVLEWASAHLSPSKPLLIYSSAPPNAVKALHAQMSSQAAGEMIEHAMGALAVGLVQRGVGQLLVAGGETSGVCVQSLGVTQLRIGPQIDPGVPWCYAQRHPASSDPQSSSEAKMPNLHLALKSGNFGREDFMTYAWTLLSPHE